MEISSILLCCHRHSIGDCNLNSMQSDSHGFAIAYRAIPSMVLNFELYSLIQNGFCTAGTVLAKMDSLISTIICLAPVQTSLWLDHYWKRVRIQPVQKGLTWCFLQQSWGVSVSWFSSIPPHLSNCSRTNSMSAPIYRTLLMYINNLPIQYFQTSTWATFNLSCDVPTSIVPLKYHSGVALLCISQYCFLLQLVLLLLCYLRLLYTISFTTINCTIATRTLL